jgi:hypothetical protein
MTPRNAPHTATSSAGELTLIIRSERFARAPTGTDTGRGVEHLHRVTVTISNNILQRGVERA